MYLNNNCMNKENVNMDLLQKAEQCNTAEDLSKLTNELESKINETNDMPISSDDKEAYLTYVAALMTASNRLESQGKFKSPDGAANIKKRLNSLIDVIQSMSTNKSNNTKRIVIVVGAVLILLGGFFAFYLSKNNQSTANGFSGVNGISDSTNVSVSKKDNLSLDADSIVAQSSSVEMDNTVDNIADFEKVCSQSLNDIKTKTSRTLNIQKFKILFTFNKYDLSSDAYKLIKAYGKIFDNTNRKATIIVQGYTCDIGKNGINNWISKQRALRVKESLIAQGIPTDNIEVQWYGKKKNDKFQYSSIKDYRRVVIMIK